MAEAGHQETADEAITTDAQGRLLLRIAQDDAAEIIERLRETHADLQGRAYLLRLDVLIERLGRRWEMKRDTVFDQLRTSFERKFPEPNWCIAINDNCFLAVLLTLGEYKGALSAAELWYTAGQFFVGDVSSQPPPLYEAIADDVDRLRLIPIDLSTYFDRAEARPMGGTRTPGGESQTSVVAKPAPAPGTMTPITRARAGGVVMTIAGRPLRIASTLEPVFEMRKLTMIGHRFEASVSDAGGPLALDGKAMSSLDWGDREQIDLANIEQGLKLLQMRAPEQRKMVMVVPAAFSTFASVRSRSKIAAMVSAASQEMALKVLFEVRNLNGVPIGRTMEIISLLRPYCMTVMGHVGADPRAIMSLKGCGLAGACVDFDGLRRDDTALEIYLTGLSTASKTATGACMIHGFDNLHQMAVARLSGVTHAGVRALNGGPRA
jgi:hypothetical protein